MLRAKELQDELASNNEELQRKNTLLRNTHIVGCVIIFNFHIAKMTFSIYNRRGLGAERTEK